MEAKLKIQLLLFFAMSLSFISLGQSKESAKSEYIIDEKIVTKKKFDSFLASLKEEQNTWYCDMLSNGAQTGYNAKDKQGNTYTYQALTENNKSVNSITKHENNKYYINNFKVTKDAFEKLWQTLMHDKKTGFYCAETNTGGRTGYTVKSKNGKIYKYSEDVNGTKITQELIESEMIVIPK